MLQDTKVWYRKQIKRVRFFGVVWSNNLLSYSIDRKKI